MIKYLLDNGIDKTKIRLLDLSDTIYYPDTRYAYAGLFLDKIKKYKIPGDLAELGVYKGDFSSYLNSLMPERKLFLFDTFEGFPKEQGEYPQEAIDNDLHFSDTSVEKVLDRMQYRESCIPIKGRFPDSLSMLNSAQTYCFVSLDADLYDPIYTGLHYFYERLVFGGYIFIHDYGTIGWPGAREAVDKFCSEKNITCLTIFDRCESAIITK